MALHQMREIITTVGTWTSRPSAFVLLAGYAIAWIIVQPETLDWHGAATLVTWAMTLFIQRAEYRDTQALQAKLDELLRSTGNTKDHLAEIDDQEPEQIEKQRAAASGDNGQGQD